MVVFACPEHSVVLVCEWLYSYSCDVAGVVLACISLCMVASVLYYQCFTWCLACRMLIDCVCAFDMRGRFLFAASLVQPVRGGGSVAG